MNQKISLMAVATAAFALAAFPASSAPVSGGKHLKAHAPSVVTQTRSERVRKRRHTTTRHAVPHNGYGHNGYRYDYGYGGGYRGYDTVGSIVYDGKGYGYNRLTGQRYMSCMFDEGYGRVRPCDAGGDGGRN